MLGPRFAQCSRLVASSSTRSLRNMHSTAAKLASLQRQKPPGDVNPVAMRHKERKALAQLNKPHVVLGHRPGDEAKWLNCDLAKILVTPEEIESMPPLQPSPPGSVDKVVLPKYMNFGLGDSDKEALFEVLPTLSLERTLSVRKPKFAKVGEQSAESTEAYKATMLARVVDLRNANARGIAFENRRRCIAAFSEPGKPNDSGRAEVQAALLTMQIRNMWDCLQKNKKDVSNRRSLLHLIHKRAKMLRYLKRKDYERWERVLERLGLEREAVEGELNL